MTKKITILATDFKPMLGGVAEYTFQLAEKLSETGVLDKVLTPNIQNESCVFKVSAPQELFCIKSLKNKGWLESKFYSLIYIFQLLLLDIKQIWSYFYSSRQIFVIVNWIISPISKRWISALNLFNIPYAVILHGKDIIVSSQNNSKWFIDITSSAKLLIFNSQATANLFQSLQTNIKTPYYILYPSININYLNQIDIYPVEYLEQIFNCKLRSKLVVCSICRLVKRKGIDLAIKSLEPILKTNKDMIYLVMGNGEEYQSLKYLISSLQLDDQILLVGEFNDREKFSLLNVSSIFIMPNNQQGGNDFEGFGISFLEASYFKNVVIGGRNGGVVEAIQDGHTGFLVDTDTGNPVESIKDIINSLIENPSQINQISEYGHKYVIDNFQSTHTVNGFSQYIQNHLLQ